MMADEFGSLKPGGYCPRVVDARLSTMLKSFGAVEVTGPKWCGKTWTAAAHANSSDTLMNAGTFDAAQTDPSLVLEGAEPHLVDEWQEIPAIWDAARNHIDANANRRGQLILTGSSAPTNPDKIRHSGTGRIARLRMYPMSLQEEGLSSAIVSLGALFSGEFQPTRNAASIEDIARWCCRGGWPAIIGLEDEFALNTPVEYINSLLQVTLPKLGKDAETARALLKALAFNISQAPTYNTLAKDMGRDVDPKDKAAVDRSRLTIASYRMTFEQLYLLEQLPGWEPPLRSKKRVRTKPKWYFVDPSLPAALFNASPVSLLKDTQTLGLLFETLCLRDLRVYLGAMPGIGNRLSYFRDEHGLEVDVVVELGDGRWGAFEIKLSDNKVTEENADKLKRFAAGIVDSGGAHNPEPLFLGFLVGKGDLAYRRADGLLVVPISTLGA
jgi:predicted AAA+ superfamily ATPase